MKDSLVEIDDVWVRYPFGKSSFFALRGITLSIGQNETLGVVGESGCGKTTLGKTLLQLQKATKGDVRFQNFSLSGLSQQQLLPFRKKMQMVFQDPDSSLNPKRTCGDHIVEALEVHHLYQGKTQIDGLFEQVGLPAHFATRYPFELSGGQKQRVSIARAIACEPNLIVLDEPLSSLDLSIRIQILSLLKELQQKKDLSYLFISHDLTTMKMIADRIAVLYLGSLCELAPKDGLYTHPRHPYTQILLSSVPQISTGKSFHEGAKLIGEPPSLIAPPMCCSFHPRCPFAKEICRHETPQLQEVASNHFCACHFPL